MFFKFADLSASYSIFLLREIFNNKKLGKSGQADPWADPPPLKRSGKCEISQQVAIFGVILPFYIGQKWVKIVTNRKIEAVSQGRGTPKHCPQNY